MKSTSCILLADAIEEAARTTPQALVEPRIAEGPPVDRLRAYAAHDEEAGDLLERLLTPAEPTTDLKAAALRHLGTLERDYLHAPAIRRGPLAKSIISALRELRVYFPPPAPTKTRDEVLEGILAADAEAISLIEQHIADPLDPKEIQ